MNCEFLKNKIILVTGGTGSFGGNFVRYLLSHSGAKKIIVFSRDELKQFNLKKKVNDSRLRFFLGDVRDLPRLERAFEGVDIVIHAAALKHVPMLEYNPFEAVKTNILGSQNVIDAALDKGVKQVVLISTDKASEPANLYGSTKLCAEKLFVSANAYGGGRTAFSCVRYGNVIGSRGSIVDTTLTHPRQDTISITHPEMTRFWISLGQSFELVRFALATMKGGEIFIPKIPSMKVTELVAALRPRAKQVVTGVRPGEKLHELLLSKEEARHAVELPEFFVILPENAELFEIAKQFKELLRKGKKLPPQFYYASDTNTEWLTKPKLLTMIGDKQTEQP